MQVCTSLKTDNHTSTSPLSFLQAGCPSCRPTNSVKALKAKHCQQLYGKSFLLHLRVACDCAVTSDLQVDQSINQSIIMYFYSGPSNKSLQDPLEAGNRIIVITVVGATHATLRHRPQTTVTSLSH